jgi:hypothetical protein
MFGFGRRRVYDPDYVDEGYVARPRWRGGPSDLDGPGRGVGFSILPLILLIWLIIGAIAAGQRGYYTDAAENCANAGTTIVTIVAGPLNYMGVNPKVENCNPNLPQPSQ